MKYARAPKFWSVGLLLVQLRGESVNGRDHNNSPRFAVKSASMGWYSPARRTVMEMWSWQGELSHGSFPFCHHWCRAISTLAWSHNGGMHSNRTRDLMLGGGPPTVACVAPFRPCHPTWPLLRGHPCWSPICWMQEVDSWFCVLRHKPGDIIKLVLSESDDC